MQLLCVFIITKLCFIMIDLLNKKFPGTVKKTLRPAALRYRAVVINSSHRGSPVPGIKERIDKDRLCFDAAANSVILTRPAGFVALKCH